MTTASQQELDDQLRKAAWANDVRRARELIKAGADVDAKDATEQSDFLITTSEGSLEMMELTIADRAAIK
ncbi:MAG: ankyrin repeat domain-containing protein, partial [Propionibacteriales bacterium]|nr:ankyrin repeat domain-containing protein [Propionibacteriales bacterium]